MDRARSGRLGSIVAVVIALVWWPGSAVVQPVVAAAVGWPPSSLVLSEVQTGGASASDEFVEIANQGPGAVDLAGLELVYATSSGSTVTRKATWASTTMLEPGRRVLVANAAGAYGATADLTYTGGFAATGGALGLRVVGGTVIDAVGWGDATSGFVERTAATAPPAGSSLERAPGGAGGNGWDTNDNAIDWFVQAVPSPQGLGASPVPAPGSTPDPTPAPTAVPTATASSTPTAVPTATPTVAPTTTPVPSATPAPTTTPPHVAIAVASARALPDDVDVTIEGTLTTGLGSLETGRSAFVQDDTGGIGLYLDATVVSALPAGTTVRLAGTLDTRFAQRVIRVDEAAIEAGGVTALPQALEIATGTAGEASEGSLVAITGIVDGAPGDLSDGLGLTVDDGSGPVKGVIGPDALGALAPRSGDRVVVRGPLGQRDSSGTGIEGYRVHATLAGDFTILAPPPTPAPTPTPTPAPTATATPSAGPSPVPSAKPSVSPTPSAAPTAPMPPAPVSLAAIRALTIGTVVSARGVVTAETGRTGTPLLLTIGDATAGIAVRLPADTVAPSRGTVIVVTGPLAAPYGQLEIRPAAGGIATNGAEGLPDPVAVGTGGLGEATDGRLLVVTGRLATKPTKAASGDLSLVLERPGEASVKVTSDSTSGITATAFQVGATYRIVGIGGQRASRSGALDGYRLWIRDVADIVKTADADPTASASPGSSGSPKPSASRSPSPKPTATIPTVTIAKARGLMDKKVAVVGIVTAPATLLDSSRRLIVVQDASGAIEVRLPDTTAQAVGTRLRVEGKVGRAYGAPRIAGDAVKRLGSAGVPAPVLLFGAPKEAHEWRLVTVRGRIDTVRKLGDRWRAELVVGRDRVVVVGQSGAGIPVASVQTGHLATVTGIVRRPYPSATDRRFGILPRSKADVRVDPGSSPGSGTRSAAGAGATGPGSVSGSSQAGTSPAPGMLVSAPDANLADLSTLAGRTVRVGGLVGELVPGGFTLDDGTATGPVVLEGAAADLLPLIEPGDAINVVGRIESTDRGWTVVVADPAGIVLAGDPVAPGASADTAGPGAATPSETAATRGDPRSAGMSSLPGIDAGIAGLGTLAALTAASVAVTVLRRRHLRRLLTARMAVRLAAFVGGTGSLDGPVPGPAATGQADRVGPRTATHDPRTIDRA